MLSTVSVVFENEWGHMVTKEKKEKRNRLSARDRKWNVLGMGIDGWSEQWFLKCGPGLEASATQDSMVLAQKQKHRSIEHDRNSRDKLTHLCLPLFEKGGKHTMEKRQPLQYVVLKNWITTCKIMKLEHFL